MKGSAALFATGLALVVAGCSGGDADQAAGDEPTAQVRLEPKVVSTTVVGGGPPRERTLLRSVVRGMPKTTLTEIAIRRRDEGVTITFTSARGASVRRQWEEWILAGAFSRRLQAAGLPAVVAAADRYGSFTARPKLRRQPDPRPLSRTQEAAVVKAIRSAATRSGGKSVRLQVQRPYGVAVALSLVADAPASFLKTRLRQLIASLIVHRPRLEGIYLAVLDERRQLVLEWGSWTRNPAGSYWVRRELANCSPIEQSGPPGTEQPPACPA